jgi:SAM-dependent methyltransferase
MAKCNFCGSPLTNVFADLGFQPPSNSFLTKDQLEQSEVYYPLKSYVCEKCWLVQVPETKKAADIFNEDYVYFSSESPANVQHAKEFADEMVERFNPKTVLEIGSNDGYMLQWFKEEGCDVLGIDPSIKCAKVSNNKGIKTYPTFFSTHMQWEGNIGFDVPANHGSYHFFKPNAEYDLICGINVLAHQPDINDFVEGVKIALAHDGVAVFEFPWLLKLVENMEFDTIYHEHFSYFSLYVLEQIFHVHGLQIFDVQILPTHGGSIRIYATHIDNRNHFAHIDNLSRLGTVHCMESGIDDLDFYKDFQWKIVNIRHDFLDFIYNLPCDEVIVSYGAAAKGNTFLNYCGIHSDLIPLVVDRSPHKQDRYLPGSHVFVTNEEDGIVNLQPDYVLILAWNLKTEIMEQLKYVRSWGGKFVVAIPKLEIL